MGDWLVIMGAAALLTGCGFMFGDLMELKNKQDDPEAVAAMLEKGIIGNRWLRMAVQALVLAGLALVTWGLSLGA
jgi:hypothetical protein